MELTLELNDKRVKADVLFAQPSDFGFAKKWQQNLGDDQNPIRNDSVEFAKLAVAKFEAESEQGTYANSLQDFRDHVSSNPKIEVGGFILLKCAWFPHSEVIGFSHFRRSWCNKIILDYLGTHPFIARPEGDSRHIVHGTGIALLYFIVQIAKQENCSALWGEATSSSATYYQRTFKLDRVDDLIFAPNEKLLGFSERCEKGWATTKEGLPAAEEQLSKIYALEVENPPFVGSKKAMFNPSKRLAFRFMKLPYHTQTEIAKKLELATSDAPGLPQSELIKAVFRRAREKSTISVLWDLVEKSYSEGAQEVNPFKTAQG